jgi:hypothetical protein
MLRNNNKVKKKIRKPYKNLGDLYKESIFGNPKINLQAIRDFIIEDGTPPEQVVDIYKKDPGSEYPDKIGAVNKDYYNKRVLPQVQLGNVENQSVRTTIQERLLSAGCHKTLLNRNLDIFQGFIAETGIVLDNEKANNFKSQLLANIQSITQFSMSGLLANSYGVDESKIIGSSLFVSKSIDSDSVITALPFISKGGAAGDCELFLSFFGNGKKEHTGDVQLDGIKIEIKGNRGKLLKSSGGSIPKIHRDGVRSALTGDRETQISTITQIVVNLAGNKAVEALTDEIKTAVSNNYDGLIKDFEVLTKDKKEYVQLGTSSWKPSILTLLAGSAHLLAYKNQSGFNAFLAFNKSVSGVKSIGIPFFDSVSLDDTIKMVHRTGINLKPDYTQGVWAMEYLHSARL